ncbi:MAG TPA: hypothetical protein ENI86_09880 [Acidimicrobiales bacterium]|nr:hypothetical protein [Acidimicrobiales bacterium]
MRSRRTVGTTLAILLALTIAAVVPGGVPAVCRRRVLLVLVPDRQRARLTLLLNRWQRRRPIRRWRSCRGLPATAMSW